MFSSAVVLIVQEVLEAALVLSLLLSLIHSINKNSDLDSKIRRTWVFLSILLGLVFAWIYSRKLTEISSAFDFAGIELVNAAIHFLSCIFLLIISWSFPLSAANKLTSFRGGRRNWLVFSMFSVVALAITREASEIFQLGGALMMQSENGLAFTAGGLVGGGIGISTGLILYFGITSQRMDRLLAVCIVLLSLTAGNMAAQALVLLNQADWLPNTRVAWDSDALLSEASIMGQLAFALIGYESRPSWLHVIFYGVGMAGIFMSPIARKAVLQKLELVSN